MVDKSGRAIIKEERDRVLGHILVVIATAQEAYLDGGRGYMVCPACGKMLVYTVASTNKHVHAKCSTDGCIMFMM